MIFVDMSNGLTSNSICDRYLRILSLQKQAPSLAYLEKIVTAHLARVPFENISKLYYRKNENLRSLLSFEKYLDGIENYNFGGTCYSNNYYLNQLLSHLGFDIKLCGAAMNNPDVHLVSIVTVDGKEYLVDVGYAAPFLKPIPRYLETDHEIKYGNNSYIIKPQDKEGCSKLEFHANGSYKHGYTVNPIARSIGHFSEVIAQSFAPESTFMNALLLVKFYPNRSVTIHNMEVIAIEGEKQERHLLVSRDELADAIEEYFNIPRNISAEAIAELGEFGDAWN